MGTINDIIKDYFDVLNWLDGTTAEEESGTWIVTYDMGFGLKLQVHAEFDVAEWVEPETIESDLPPYRHTVGEGYAEALGCKIKMLNIQQGRTIIGTLTIDQEHATTKALEKSVTKEVENQITIDNEVA